MTNPSAIAIDAAAAERRAIAEAIGMPIVEGQTLHRWQLIQFIVAMKVRLDRVRELVGER